MKKSALIVMALGIAFWVVTAANSQDALSHSNKEAAKKIKQLQQERISVLMQLAEVSTKLYQNARAEAGDAVEAQQLLLSAQIDAAENDNDRIKLYENMIQELDKLEQLATAKVEAARGTHMATYRIKSQRLAAQIALERLKAKMNP